MAAYRRRAVNEAEVEPPYRPIHFVSNVRFHIFV